MAVTKILARRGGLAQAIAYVVNGDKTEEQVLTATQGCSIKSACAEMQDAKIRWNKTDGVQLYNGMTLERFLLAYIRSEFLFPRRLVFKSDNIYAKALENSTIKEALKLD